ncbi:helix-turn-helix transcriptional regulator [Elizabethkingia anophelis]|nr:helix-turn-helix transcriptional regulator [Elizabethkingia anophelis]MCT4062923.1 helix-turn-helix transcriptional regulator [Elizabethkingia anophelis]MCT4109214.1 helix-turn-helix transcriptional regulator [Elizabethkingia anophelis]
MFQDQQAYPIETLHLQMEINRSQVVQHRFTELIYIWSGTGTHTNRHMSTRFVAGDMYWVQSRDEHHFEIETFTEVFIVRFTEEARLVLKDLVDQSNGKAIALAKAKSPVNLKINFSLEDKNLIEMLFHTLLALSEQPLKNENMAYYQLLCMVNIIERNLKYSEIPVDSKGEKDLSKILNYIHKNIQDPDMLQLAQIAQVFNLHINSLGLYFRKELNIPIKKYIRQSRMEIIEKKVLKSDFSLSEIAFQFGFVDESHFYKQFKKHFGISPSEYRKCGVKIEPQNKL